ncbi:unnamed protein product [Hymenolepis diminuta]|uniref:PX domain-containing protein n=2 Tax=Hymenolepis diminuta TaxID=6216 RepID=A0A0R3STM5_HYMDI|nr:unnamed protein product [Hymenolepis diminuta]VUZ41640.1 unnamed protein product [Hymenolepis diminuta]
MLEESKEGSPIFFNSEGATGFSNKESLPSLPASGEVISRITGTRKMVTNYETYIAYEIQTVANRKDYPSEVRVVERRYREFDWLYSRFISIYAVLFVPPLPGKEVLTQFNRYASDFVDRRCSGLQTFLHKSSSHPILSSNSDFIAFLTLSRNDFQTYMQRFSIESSLLSSLIGQPTQVLPSAGIIGTTGNSEQQLVNTSNPPSTTGLLPPSSNPVVTATTREVARPQQLRQASEKFTRYQIMVIQYITLCQRLSSLVNRMTNQLATLSYDYAELAKTLEEAGQSTVAASSAGATNIEGGWASALVGSAMRQTARATHALASKLSNNSACAWHENAAFGEAVKRVLKNRQAIQDAYFSLDQEIKDRQRIEAAASEDVMYQHPQAQTFTDSAAPIGGTQTNSTSRKWLARFASMPWGSKSKNKNRPISELVGKLTSAYRDLSFANSRVEAEWHHWESERARETAESLTTLTSAYVVYWGSLVDAWRSVNIHLKGAPQSTGESGVVAINNPLKSTSMDVISAAAESTIDSLLKSNSVEIPARHGDTLNEIDLSSSSKNPEGKLEEEKGGGWTVVDLSVSPSVERRLDSTAMESE